MALSAALSELRERIRTVGDGARGGIDVVGTSVRLGGVHEWFGAADPDGGRPWRPPLCVLADVARRAIARGIVARVFWIGTRIWPYPLLFDRHRDALRASVLIDPPDDPSRVWAIDMALRSSAPVAVIADGEGLTLAHTRRLQLAAGGGGGLCLLARPAWELDRLSAATTRWGITPTIGSTVRPRWTLALLRNKDRPVFMAEPHRWTVEWNHAQGLVCVPAAVADRACRATAQAS